MKILFICSSTNKTNHIHSKIVPFIYSQAKSLEALGHKVDFHLTEKGGFQGYFQSLLSLYKKVSQKKYDVLHAHYVFSGWISLLARKDEKLICSFMGTELGTDYKKGIVSRFKFALINILSKALCPFLDKIIVKSDNLYQKIPNSHQSKANIIPNGVSNKSFFPLEMDFCKKVLNLSLDKKYILFPSNTNDPRKNFNLLKQSLKYLDSREYEILLPYPTLNKYLLFYYNASHVTVSTSFWEGSQNTLKESLFCNCPIVSTKSGDSEIIIQKVKGSYLSDYSPEDLSLNIKKASKERFDNLESIKHLGLENIAQSIELIYNE